MYRASGGSPVRVYPVSQSSSARASGLALTSALALPSGRPTLPWAPALAWCPASFSVATLVAAPVGGGVPVRLFAGACLAGVGAASGGAFLRPCPRLGVAGARRPGAVSSPLPGVVWWSVASPTSVGASCVDVGSRPPSSSSVDFCSVRLGFHVSRASHVVHHACRRGHVEALPLQVFPHGFSGVSGGCCRPAHSSPVVVPVAVVVAWSSRQVDCKETDRPFSSLGVCHVLQHCVHLLRIVAYGALQWTERMQTMLVKPGPLPAMLLVAAPPRGCYVNDEAEIAYCGMGL